MARIYLSPLIVDIRNKQSDTVFSKWKGINYIRSRVVPHNPKSAAQMAVRNALKELVVCWQEAAAGVKLNWDEYSSGRDYSGFNKFIGKNVLKERDDELIDLTQEVGFTKLPVFSAATGGVGGKITVTFTPTPVPANTSLELHFREVSEAGWTLKITRVAATTSPYEAEGLTVDTLYEVYGFLVNDTDPEGDEVGKDMSDTATSSAAA